MQTQNVDLPITVTGRHKDVTDEMRAHAEKRVSGLHLDYPKIIDAQVILDVQTHKRYIAEVVLHCANHITIEAHTTTDDMIASIDETMHKIARRMRKYKTRMLKSHRPRKKKKVRHLEEAIFSQGYFETTDLLEETTAPAVETLTDEAELEPYLVHQESYRVKPLYPDEAIMDLEMSERPFLLFHNSKTDKLSIVFRRDDGDYGMVVPEGDSL